MRSPAQRAFYEAECVAGGWSVKELKRQINSLLHERSALSTDRGKLTKQTHAGAERDSTALNIRDPYVFEFLGLTPREVMSESHLEDQLLDRLQTFLMELGQGFCFEARQKRILIGHPHGIDAEPPRSHPHPTPHRRHPSNSGGWDLNRPNTVLEFVHSH